MAEVSDLIKDNWHLVAFIGAQVVTYLKLKWKVEGLFKSVNGIGQKLNEVDRTLSGKLENLKEEIADVKYENLMSVSKVENHVARIDGYLERVYKPRSKNGEA